MKIKRIVSNIEPSDSDKARAFYLDVLGLKLMRDHGGFRTYG